MNKQDHAQPFAWATHHDEPMIFPTRKEAAAYCDEDEEPIALYAAPAQPQPPKRTRVLLITTAYEQGFGHANRDELSNPYVAESEEAMAWDMGREEGRSPQREQWIPLSQQMPEPGSYVLAHNGKWTGVAAWWGDDDDLEASERWQDEHREFVEHLGPAVTHWMPIPYAPSGITQQGADDER